MARFATAFMHQLLHNTSPVKEVQHPSPQKWKDASDHVMASSLHSSSWKKSGVEQGHFMWTMGSEQFCQGCLKQHTSTVWYYRRSADGMTREWLCGIKYLVLDMEHMELWHMYPVFL